MCRKEQKKKKKKEKKNRVCIKCFPPPFPCQFFYQLSQDVRVVVPYYGGPVCLRVEMIFLVFLFFPHFESSFPSPFLTHRPPFCFDIPFPTNIAVVQVTNKPQLLLFPTPTPKPPTSYTRFLTSPIALALTEILERQIPLPTQVCKSHINFTRTPSKKKENPSTKCVSPEYASLVWCNDEPMLYATGHDYPHPPFPP